MRDPAFLGALGVLAASSPRASDAPESRPRDEPRQRAEGERGSRGADPSRATFASDTVTRPSPSTISHVAARPTRRRLTSPPRDTSRRGRPLSSARQAPALRPATADSRPHAPHAMLGVSSPPQRPRRSGSCRLARRTTCRSRHGAGPSEMVVSGEAFCVLRYSASASTRRGTSCSATEHSATRRAPFAGTTKTPFSFIREARSWASSANTVTKNPPS